MKPMREVLVQRIGKAATAKKNAGGILKSKRNKQECGWMVQKRTRIHKKAEIKQSERVCCR